MCVTVPTEAGFAIIKYKNFDAPTSLFKKRENFMGL